MAITVLGFWVFPGHTILQSDSQIYLPILEHLYDPEVLDRDPIAVNPHVAFTIYDEVAVALRHATGAGFEAILTTQQFVYRLIGVAALYWIGLALGLSGPWALCLSAILSLGAAISGPAVLLTEFEPVPRGFALPFLFASLALLLHDRWGMAALAAGISFLFHPPTALVFSLVLAALLVSRRNWTALLILIAAAGVLLLMAITQTQPGEHIPLFGRIEPDLERLQRFRAGYNWVSMWIATFGWHFLFLWSFSLAALARMRRPLPPAFRVFVLGLPLIGMLSVPASYLLLEKLKWVLMPELQPCRGLLFVTFFAFLLGILAALDAARAGQYLEAAFCFFVVFLIPQTGDIFHPPIRSVLTSLLLSAAAAMIAAKAASQFAGFTLGLLPFLAIPLLAGLHPPPLLATPELQQLSAWAHRETKLGSIFAFPRSGRSLEPGVFRARAERALYVDWKSGGQVNFLPKFADLWWRRWSELERPLTFDRYAQLGIDFVVFPSSQKLRELSPVYENKRYVVYRATTNATLEIRALLSAMEPRPALLAWLPR